MHHSHHKQPNEQMTRNSNTTMVTSPSLSPVKTTFSGQGNMSCMKPGLLPSNLDDLKVSELRQQLRIRGLPVSGTKTSLMERLRPFQECSSNTVPTFSEITTVTFPVTPNNSGFQSHPSGGVISNGFYQFGSTSSTPPISPASSDLSVNGSLPDTFSDGPISSPQYGLHPSPIHLSAEDSLMSSINSGNYQIELEGMDTEKDKMLVEKQKVINELTWKLQQEQRQVEELRLQLQKRKGNCGSLDKAPPSQHFFGVHIKQEKVSSCPFSSNQIPQCSPQHSPIGTTNSPQHISLPPLSPNNHYLLSVSPSSQGDTCSVSPQVNHRINTTQNTSSSVCYSPNQNTLQPPYIDQSENKQSIKDRVPPKSSSVLGKINDLQPSPQAGQKIPTPGTNFTNATSSVSKQLPSYEDAVRQDFIVLIPHLDVFLPQQTRSQQMDELLDVLIESGEMPANAKDERSCGQKLNQLSVSTGNPSVTTSNPHLPYENCSNNDNHLEVLLSTHSPMGRPNEIPLLKIGNDDPHFERVIDGFSGKSSEEMLETSLSPMETQLSPSSVDSNGLQHLSFTESPWETMEWLDLTPPSSATGLGSLTTTGPSIFNTDFLDVTDLNLNNTMDLHLEQW
ncbi:unnamed protein product [Ranitomeya imitator]|uniref:SAP domain-containing protein n=1 Tax=Ranitomeya imitator TaxID=111125 RepID=A0ABN9M853_9NEOB|nr:unnamed protein product [Ranitomeya imitator]